MLPRLLTATVAANRAGFISSPPRAQERSDKERAEKIQAALKTLSPVQQATSRHGQVPGSELTNDIERSPSNSNKRKMEHDEQELECSEDDV